jgi:hypothetical protein
MPLYSDAPGLRFDQGYRFDQVEDFPNKPGSAPPTVSPKPTPNHRPRKHRMNDRQRNQLNRLINVEQFCVDHAAAFTNTPAKPGDVKFAAAKAKIIALIPQISGQQATQASGSYGQATMNQAVERQELVDLLRTVNRTAAAIALDKNEPGIMDRFRMPGVTNDALLVATGEAFATAITELNLAADFTDHGYEGDIVADLNAEAADVREAESSQGGALQGQGGATASLPGLLKAGAHAVKQLDAIVKNRFRNAPATLGAWKIASHVMSTGGGGGEEPPAPTPPSPPPAG